MAERADRGGLLTLEDQGTIFMFSLLLVLIVGALTYFACVWYRKKKAKEAPKENNKPAVSKTFSRFSQVDEELTVHMGTIETVADDDDDKGDNGDVKTKDGSNTNIETKIQTESRPPYLETDI